MGIIDNFKDWRERVERDKQLQQEEFYAQKAQEAISAGLELKKIAELEKHQNVIDKLEARKAKLDQRLYPENKNKLILDVAGMDKSFNQAFSLSNNRPLENRKKK